MLADAERLAGRELIEARARRLSDRCYMIETTPEGSANSGVIVGDERVMVIDTRVLPAMGADLAATVRETTGAAAADLIVVNTHYHGDHVFGNGAFRDSTIVASRLTLEAERREWERQLAIYRDLRPHQRDELARVQRVTPSIGFEGSARVDLGGVEVELEPVGPAHTPGDLAVLAPSEGVVFAADLVFHGHWPVMWDADVAGWIRALDELAQRGMATVVPGHGAAGGGERLEQMKSCLRFLIELELAGDGRDEDAAVAGSAFASYLHRDRVAEARRRIREQATDELAAIGAAAL